MDTEGSAHRSVTVSRIGSTKFAVANDRGGEMTIGVGEGSEFTPVELLLAAIGGCTAIDVDILTSRRSEPEAFTVRVDAEKVRDDLGNHLADIVVTFQVAFPATAGGDDARAILPDVVRKSHERLCSVGRTVEIGTPIATRIG
jgi:putative redox protein